MSRYNKEWVFPFARAIRNAAGQLQAVLVVGTRISKFRDAIRIDHLPADSVVRILNDKGVVVAAFLEAPGQIGCDLSRLDAAVRHLQTKELSEVSTWSDKVPRFTGYSTAHRAPWLAIVKQVVLKHGGTLRIEDTTPGGASRGTSIRVLLPARLNAPLQACQP